MKKYYYILTVCFLLISAAGGFCIGQNFCKKDPPPKPAGLISQTGDPAPPSNRQADGDKAKKKASADISSFGVDIMIADKCCAMLMEEYINEVSLRKLVAGAVKGMRETAAERKLDPSAIAEIPADTPGRELLDALHKSYYDAMDSYGDRITESDLAYGALDGMLDSLKDPYSVAMDPATYKILSEYMSGGNYGGIGVYLEKNKKTGRLTVLNAIKDGPAYKAGIRSGDVIVKIDGEKILKTDLELASHKIRGKSGTKTRLVIERGAGNLKEFTVTRAIIHEKSVERSMKPGKIGYVKISVFGEDTGKEFSEALKFLESKGARGIIMDLRSNSGGYINSAIDVCSRIMESGSLIVSVVNPRNGRNEVYRSYGNEKITMPLVVIVNGNSASASEITAGAIRDILSAPIVGERTFGKAAVQTIKELKDGGAIKFTVAKYLTPKGADIDKTGLTPDITVKMDPKNIGTAADVQMQRAMSEMKRLTGQGQGAGSGKDKKIERPVDPLNDL